MPCPFSKFAAVSAIVCMAFAGGCTTKGGSTAAPRAAGSSVSPGGQPAGATSRPALGPNALVKLDDIEPRPLLVQKAVPSATGTAAQPPSTRDSQRDVAWAPASRPSLDALELYARARDALATNQRFTAINSLEKAVKLDPYSAEPLRLLSRAYAASGNTAKSLEYLVRAAELAPDDLRTQTTLGRLYLNRGNATAALVHLRLALQTTEYSTDEGGAAVADFFLARALQQLGYDAAALERFELVLQRLDAPSLAIRGDPELSDWADRPQAIFVEVARLYEKLGDDEEALRRWKQVSESEPDDYDARTRVIHLQIALGRRDEALRESANYVRRSGASQRSLELLRDVCRRTGDADAAFDELRRLQTEMPSDRAVTYALVDLLISAGRDREAEELLSTAARAHWDAETVRKLFSFYSSRHRAPEAAGLLIEAAAARPDETSELVRLFTDLLRPQRRDTLRASDIAALNLSSGAAPGSALEASQLYFTAVAARGQQRDAFARDALERAGRIDPPFAPVQRELMARIWMRPDVDDGQKTRQSEELIASMRARGAPDLADELSAMALVQQGQIERAAAALDRVVREAGKRRAGYVDLVYADLQRLAGNPGRFEQVVWRVISDHPTWEGPYLRLINHNTQSGRAPAALSVLQRWIAADPGNPSARLIEATLLFNAGQAAEAARQAEQLLRSYPTDPEVVNGAAEILVALSRQSDLLAALEHLHSEAPGNLVVLERLVDFYIAQSRRADAVRAIDESRRASAREARLLYYTAHLYSAVDRKDLSQETLEQALALSPDDPGINNDLGYTWADEGVQLDRAEPMIRKAVSVEPDNGSFLDSLGWVLYKRGRFDEARQNLQQAIEVYHNAALPADPVLFDHLGDTLYRLRDPRGAGEKWRAAQERIESLAADRPDMLALRERLKEKLAQLARDVPVSVAPLDASLDDPARQGSAIAPSPASPAARPARAENRTPVPQGNEP